MAVGGEPLPHLNKVVVGITHSSNFHTVRVVRPATNAAAIGSGVRLMIP
jgi:hypothetical protein